MAIKVPLAQHQHDALVSFDLNTGGIYRARLTAAINAGDRDASRHFFGWLKPPEIRGRRTAEKALFETGAFDANGDRIAVWRTNGAGRLSGVLKNLSGAELLARLDGVSLPADLPALPDLTPVEQALGEVEVASAAMQSATQRLRAAFAAVAA